MPVSQDWSLHILFVLFSDISSILREFEVRLPDGVFFAWISPQMKDERHHRVLLLLVSSHAWNLLSGAKVDALGHRQDRDKSSFSPFPISGIYILL